MKNKAEFRAPMSKDRKPLAELLPLKSPLSIYIDPSSICNFACKFCFQANKDIKKQMQLTQMTMDTFEKILDSIKEFDESIKMVHLHGFGEPLLNKNFYKMVQLLKQNNVDRVATTTNASMLDEQNARNIIESKLDQIHISIYGLSDENYLSFSNKKISFNKILSNIKYFHALNTKYGNCHIHIKINGDYYSNEDKERFLRIFENYCDSIFIDRVANIWPMLDISETLKINLSKEQKEDSTLSHQYGCKKENNLCPSIFYQLMIHSNGDISPCCADYLGKITLGNIKTHNLKSLWGGNFA